MLAQLVAEKSPAAVLIASTAEGKEIAGRLAVKSGSGVITDAVDVAARRHSRAVGVRRRDRRAVARSPKGTPIITVRPNSVAPRRPRRAADAVDVAVELSAAANAAKIVDRVVQAKGGRPDLTEAAIVVSGGRGVGGGRGLRDHRGAGRLARRRRRCLARRDRRRLVPAPVPGRPDRQDRGAAALHGATASPGPSSTGPACRPRRRSS